MFISKKEYDEKIKKSYNSGKTKSESEISKLESSNSKLLKEVQKLKLDKEEYLDELVVLRKKHKQFLLNTSKSIELQERESKITANEKIQLNKSQELDQRASMLNDEEEKNYVKGYADGLADGLRKVHEITAEDRNNLAKIAMVSAASHTDINTMKEVNNEFRLADCSKTDKENK